MGIHNRDYIRDDRAGRGVLGSSDQWAIKYLLIANIAVFVLQLATLNSRDGGATSWLSLHITDLYRFEIWRLVTYGFCHDPRNMMHIAVNMYVLWIFGRLVEPIYGSREFLAFYLAAVVVSGLCFVGVHAMQPNPAIVLGASGGVMAVVMLAAMLFPRMTVLFMFVIPIEFRWLAVMYVAADLSGFLQGGSNVAHVAHLGGAAFGIAYKYYNWRILRAWSALRSRTPRSWVPPVNKPKVRIYEPKPENLDEQVDAILDKIHREGEASLTDRERMILKDASQRYKNR